MTALCFLDTETTGLDPDRHDMWEIGYILRGNTSQDRDLERRWLIRPGLSRADPMGLTVSRYYQRTVGVTWNDPHEVAFEVARDLDGRHIVGAVPSFDVAFLSRFLRAHGQCLTAHYQPVDVETLAVGYLHGYREAETDHGQEEITFAVPPLPWDSELLSEQLGVAPPTGQDRHTALGDARWARDLYDALTS